MVTSTIMLRFLKLIVVVPLLQGCWGWSEPPFVPEFPVGKVEGYQPVYVASENSAIAFEAPRPLRVPGKVYVVRQYLLVNEKFEGIHVFDNTDPADPRSLGFLKVSGNIDMAVRGGVLYVDHMTDLVALDVTDWSNIREVSRIRQDSWALRVPPAGRRYFECVDHTRGTVVGWQLTTLDNPRCFR